MKLYLRSLLFTAILFLSVIPYAFVAMLMVIVAGSRALLVARAWARLNLWLLHRLCGLDYRVEGREHIPERRCVVYWKHSSAWETIAQLLIFPEAQSWVLKRELLWVPIFGWALYALRPIAINRGAGRSAVQQVLRQGAERLAAGRWVMIFPEGTRMPAGRTRRYGLSGALLAAENGVSVLPVAHNAGDFWPRRGLRKRPGTILVRIGPPIPAAGRDPEAINAEAQNWIETQMREISAVYREAETKKEEGQQG